MTVQEIINELDDDLIRENMQKGLDTYGEDGFFVTTEGNGFIPLFNLTHILVVEGQCTLMAQIKIPDRYCHHMECSLGTAGPDFSRFLHELASHLEKIG